MKEKLLLGLFLTALCVGGGVKAREFDSSRHFTADDRQKDGITLKDYLKDLEAKFNVNFGFANKTIENKNVTLQQQAAGNIEEALTGVLSPLGLAYKEVEKGFYVIHSKTSEDDKKETSTKPDESAEDENGESRTMTGQGVQTATYESNGQEVTVSGRVIDVEDQSPIPGVTVMVKGTSRGTITDIDGRYTLTVPEEDAVLLFSFVGYITEEVAVNGRTVVNVSMAYDIETLSEVVIVGYGEQKRANLTGSVVAIEAEELEDLPVGNLSQALIGRLAGVKIGQSTGKPGAANPLVIRTSSSIAVEENVLYVIDGIIYDINSSPTGSEIFNRLDASEVESISVLKDAAAAIYGARASGGVVLVKTKRGTKGKPKISFSSSVGVGQPTQIPEMLSAYEHAKMLNEINDWKLGKYETYENGEFIPASDYEFRKTNFPAYYTEDELEAFKSRDYDWLEGLYQDALTLRNTLNVSGGSEDVRYFVGGSYYKQTGNFDNLYVKKYSVRANIEANISKNVVFNLGLSTNRSNDKEPYYSEDSQPGVLRDWYKRLLTAPRWVPPTVDGLPVFVEGTWNPYGLMQSDNFDVGSSNNTNITGALDYHVPVVKGLKLRAQYSYNEANSRGNRFAQDYYAYKLKNTGEKLHVPIEEFQETNAKVTIGNREGISESAGHSKFYQLNASITYNRTFGLHNISALVVYEQNESEGRDFNVRKSIADIKGYNYLWAFSNSGIEVGSGASESGRLSYIGRLNYDYNGKYLIETAFRREASQRYHPDYAWGFFPSVSAGWIISEEGFFRDNISFIDFLKIRASAGRVGNDNGPPFNWKYSYTANITGPLFGTTPLLSNAIQVRNEGIASPTITWQKTNSYNVGLDARMFNHKVNLGVDYYYRYTFDILTRRSSYPSLTGVEKPPYENLGIMYAEGVELQLGYSDKIGRDFEYSIDGIFSWDNARPLKIDQNPAAVGRWDDQLKNHPSNQPGWIALGIIRTQEDLEKVLTMYDSISGVPVGLGMIYYKDIRGENWSEGPDGKLDTWDRDIIAEYTTPPFNYGFTLGASWKNLKVRANFSGAFGHKVFISKDEQTMPTANTNIFSWWGDYWTPENPGAALPRPYLYGLEEQNSTFWMRDGHTLRLNNINVSYALPENIESAWNLPQLRLYFTATNLWTIISPYDYKDPAVSRAYDYPLVRTYNVGVNISL